MFNLATLLLPLAVDLIRSYIKNSHSHKDDQILSVVQEGCYYLASKDNNDLNIYHADYMSTHKMIGDKQ